MAPPAEISIVGAGSQSAVGATLRVQGAAVHAQLARIGLHPDTLEPSPISVRVARAGFLGEHADDPSRLAHLLAAVVREAMGPLESAPIAEVSVWLKVPQLRPPYRQEDFERLAQVVAQALGSRMAQPVTLLGEVSPLAAVVSAAAEALQAAPQHALSVLVAADSLVSDDAMDELVEARRLAREDRAWGLVPGEGASCIVLAREETARTLGLPTMAGLAAWAGGASDAKGGALSQAVQACLRARPDAVPLRRVFADLNGERGRSDAWAFASGRFATALHPTMEQILAAGSHGDLGVATGVALVALAADELASGRFNGPVLVGTQHGECQATALVLMPAAGAAPRAEPARGEDEQAFDRGVVDELMRELAVVCERRLDWLGAQARAPLPDWTERAMFDRRIDRLCVALACCGHLGEAAVRDHLASGDRGLTYVAARVLVALSGPSVLWESGVKLSDANLLPWAEALRDAQVPWDAVVSALLARPGWERLGLVVASHAGTPPLREPVLRAAHLGPGPLGWAFPMALLRLGRPEDLWHLNPWLQAEDAATLQAAIVTWLRLSPAQATDWLLTSGGSALALLGLTGDARAFDWLLGGADEHAQRASFYLALGQLGDPRGLPCLIEGLSIEAVAFEAAAALALVTGAGFVEQWEEVRVAPDEELFADELARRRAGDTEVGVTRAEQQRLCRKPEVWAEWLATQGQGLVRGKRHRLGRRLDQRVAVASLQASWVPPRLRALLAAELGIVFGLSSPVDPDAPAPVQKRMLETAAEEAQGRMGLAAGAWGVFRDV